MLEPSEWGERGGGEGEETKLAAPHYYEYIKPRARFLPLSTSAPLCFTLLKALHTSLYSSLSPSKELSTLLLLIYSSYYFSSLFSLVFLYSFLFFIIIECPQASSPLTYSLPSICFSSLCILLFASRLSVSCSIICFSLLSVTLIFHSSFTFLIFLTSLFPFSPPRRACKRYFLLET